MNLTTLTHTSAVCVQAHYASRDEAIRQLTMRLVALGKITDGEAFLAEVYRCANRWSGRGWTALNA